jgi:hypothetical protein
MNPMKETSTQSTRAASGRGRLIAWAPGRGKRVGQR